MQNGYAGSGQFQPGAFGVQGQQFQPGTHPNSNNTSYSNLNYPQAPYGSGQQFGSSNPNRLAHKQSDNNLLLIALAALVVVVIIFVLLLVFHNNSSTAANPPATATTAPAPSPTTAPTSTPTPTDTPTPTPTLAPTAPPTPAPDPGFAWCNTSCISQGFQLEYPATWASTPAGTSVQFINPQLSEITATFKKPGTAYADSTQAMNGEMSSTYANQPGFTPPAGAGQGNTTIGGENWSYTTIHYTLNGQPVRVEIIATIHQGSAYIIDLQAYEGEFDQVNQQYFVPMTGHFQFQ